MTVELRNGQTPNDMLMRHGIPLTFGTETYRVRPRTMKRDKAWIASVQDHIVGRIGVIDDPNPVRAVIAAFGDATDDMLALILAYEDNDAGLSRQLPPAEWFADNAYTQQITAAFTTLLEVAYPPFAVSRRLLPADRAAGIIGKLIEYVMDKVIVAMDEPAEEPAEAEPADSLPSEPLPSALPPSPASEPLRKSRKPGPMVSSKS